MFAVKLLKRHNEPNICLICYSLLAVLAVFLFISLMTGAGYISVGESLNYLLGKPEAIANNKLTVVIETLRMPRSVAAIIVGGCLGIAGALMQSVTRNPIAEPGLLGVNAGAALGVVVGISFAAAETGQAYLAWAFMGALIGNGVILWVANQGAVVTPIKLILAGIAISATFQGVTSFLLINNQATYDQYRYWVLGSLAGINLTIISQILPFLVIGIVLSLVLSRPLACLMLGDDVAKSLGHKPGLIRFIVTITVTLLAGGSVALAGPVSFLGLIAPFLARAMTGPVLFHQLILSALLGALIVLVADISARLIVQPFEAPVGVILAIVGAPLLIGLTHSNHFNQLLLSKAGN
ncbi:iron ABC transporter permease [Endozoicomonas sp. SM1973]|uniref:Iron ABC transporter permease n=1 Tax=Spartinivicinus marinus TaxID=2994442 RepID=A0A853HTH9_9GAMM|nr:iron ABC transporter permease [Spartinivicinus marinus]MCX4029496.1 iron ABC transporter permease [Spartinivicinus marinus]NYZ65070.1 iron ABC transporter permease [Spartinivicinus marinus]